MTVSLLPLTVLLSISVCNSQPSTAQPPTTAIVSDFSQPDALHAWRLDRAGTKSNVELVAGPNGMQAAQVTFVCDAPRGATPPNMALMRAFDGRATAGAGFTRLTCWHKGDGVNVVFVEQDRGDYYVYPIGPSKEWRRAAVCFDCLNPGYNAGGKGKGRFDLTRMERLRLMVPATPGKTNRFAVAQLALERSPNDAEPRVFTGSRTPARLDLYPQRLRLPVNRTQPLVVVVANERRCGLAGVKIQLTLDGPGGLSDHGDRTGKHVGKSVQLATDGDGKALARFHPQKQVGQSSVIHARLVDTANKLTARAELVTAEEFHKVRLGRDGFFVKPNGQRILPLGGFWMSWSREVVGHEARARVRLPLPCSSPAAQHAWYAYLQQNGVNCLRGYWMPSPPMHTIFPLDGELQDMSRLDRDGRINEPVLAALERTLAIGGQHGIGATLTIAPCAGLFIGGGAGNGAWRRLPEGKSRAQVLHEAEDYLRAVVPRLMFNPHVWAYELMNEQHDNTFAWSERFIRLIKELDEVTPVMVSIAVGLHSADPLAWMRNTSLDVYQPHVYTRAERADVDSGLTMEVHNNATAGPKPWLLGESGLFGFEQEEKGAYVNRDCLWFALLNRASGAFLWGDDHRSVTQCKLAAEIIPLVDWPALAAAPGAVAVPIPRDTSGRTAFGTAEGKQTLAVMADYARWALEHGVTLDFPPTQPAQGVSCSLQTFTPPAIASPFQLSPGYQLKCRMSSDGRLVLGYLRNVASIIKEKGYCVRQRRPTAAQVRWHLPRPRYTLDVWNLDTGHRTTSTAAQVDQWTHAPTEHDFVLLWRAGT
jgi:hypothetical protein